MFTACLHDINCFRAESGKAGRQRGQFAVGPLVVKTLRAVTRQLQPWPPLFLLGMSTLSVPATPVVYRDVTLNSGITHVQREQNALPVSLPVQTYMSGSASAVDYDNDGWTDLYFTRLDDSDLLYRNQGDGSFVDVTDSTFGPGHLEDIRSNGCAWADIDNDGDQDLYVTSLGTNRYHLFINNGSGSFTEEALERGAAITGPDLHFGFSASFGDYDNDGYLDLHVSEWRYASQNPDNNPPNTRLLRNLGAKAPGHFEDTTITAGVVMDQDRLDGPPEESLAFTSRFADLDGDGWPELLAISDGMTSRLFWNNCDGTFTDGTLTSNVGTDQFGMGSALGDYDGDGDLDWFITSINDPAWGDGNRLYRYEGGRLFSDVTSEAGVRDGGWGWGATFLDHDNDRDLDLMMVNGSRGFPSDRTKLWENDGRGRYEPADAGIRDRDIATGLLCLDYDNDGDLDTVVVNNSAAPILYRNDGGNGFQWLRIKLVGRRSNRDGIGAVVRLRRADADPVLMRFVDGGNNFLGQNEKTIHLGLGPETVEEGMRIEIEWPSGITQVIRDASPNQLLTVTEPLLTQVALSGIRRLTGGEMETRWQTSPGTMCLFETSQDLIRWSKAGHSTSHGSETTWRSLPSKEGKPPRLQFYRAWESTVE